VPAAANTLLIVQCVLSYHSRSPCAAVAAAAGLIRHSSTHLVQCGRQCELFIEPDHCARPILVGEGQNTVCGTPPAFASLPADSNGLGTRWPWLQGVHVDVELKPSGVEARLPFRKHAFCFLLLTDPQGPLMTGASAELLRWL